MAERRRLMRRMACPACLLIAMAGCATTGTNRAEAPPPPELIGPPVVLERPPALVVEAMVVDRKGAPVDTLNVRDFEVAVDGRRRNGVALARLYRGPGASLLASSVTSTAPGEALPVPETRRTVVVIVDQPSLAPGDERRAHDLVDRCLAALAVSDRIAVLSLPIRAGPTTISFERTAIREALASLRPLRLSGAEACGRVAADVRPLADDAPRPGGGGAGDPVRVEAGDEGRGASTRPGPAGARTPDVAGTADVSPAALKAHALSSLGGLHQILRALEQVPGGKTIVLISAGLVATDSAAELRAVTEDAARAQARIFVVQVLSSSGFGDAGARDLHLLAQETGGRVVPPTNKPEQALERLAAQLAFSYLLLLAPMPGDADPIPHALKLALPRRPDLMIQAAKQVFPGRLAPEALAASLSPRAVAESAALRAPPVEAPAPGARSARAPFRHDPALDVILERVSEYVWEYGRELSSVVSEETYKQEVRGGSNGDVVIKSKPAQSAVGTSRTLVSDFLLVKVPGFDGWLPFRDVFEVDGEPVRDRENRLVKLFLKAPVTSATLESAARIWRESARYNIGNIQRDINVPTLPLWFLEPDGRRRFAFRKSGEETIDRTRLWVIEYAEAARPTFIHTPAGGPVDASGKIWVEPLNGRIHKTVLKASIATITVTYAPREELPGLWLPVAMKEHYSAGGLTITGDATYAKFRQFQVSTTEQIVLPKK